MRTPTTAGTPLEGRTCVFVTNVLASAPNPILRDMLEEGSQPHSGRHGGTPIPGQPPPKRHPNNPWPPDARARDRVDERRTLLIVRSLASGPRRFVELQR